MKNPQAIKEFGLHLRRLRESKNLSQQQLAHLADVAKRTIIRVENGNATATNDLMISLARGLEIVPKDLMDFPLPKEKRK